MALQAFALAVLRHVFWSIKPFICAYPLVIFTPIINPFCGCWSVLPLLGKLVNLLIVHDGLKNHLGILSVFRSFMLACLVHGKVDMVLGATGGFVRTFCLPVPFFST